MSEVDSNKRGCYGKVDPPGLRRLSRKTRSIRKRGITEGPTTPEIEFNSIFF